MNTDAVLIQSLQNPALYPHPVECFKLIETHISWVILTGKYAYKIKKPLNLGFLDFSSLAKRRFYCHEEMRLNSRLAVDIYLGVVAITGTEQQPKVNESGMAIEYAVKMRQFEVDNTFDQLLARNQLTSKHIKQTAKIIAVFHGKIASTTKTSKFGSPDAIMQPVQENFSQILHINRFAKSSVLSGSINQLASWSEQQYSALQSLFIQRKETGFIRECHGDLHLANIALIADQVVPFDGIEFNPFLYWIDVISEVAFLVMDLQDKQRNDLAFQFLNEYLQQSGDYASLQLLRFYLVYRCMVRAKVSAIRASQCTGSEEHSLAIICYNNYIQLAKCYTQSHKPCLIIMNGVSGSGKSWLSEQIINRFPAIRIRSDIERKRLQGLSPHEQSYSGVDAGLYSRSSSDMTYQRLWRLASEILKADYNVIVDATFLQQQQRELFSRLAKEEGTVFLIIRTQTDSESLLRRIRERANQEENVSEADQSVLEYQLKKLQKLNDEELKCSISIDTNKETDLIKLWKRIDANNHFGSDT